MARNGAWAGKLKETPATDRKSARQTKQRRTKFVGDFYPSQKATIEVEAILLYSKRTEIVAHEKV